MVGPLTIATSGGFRGRAGRAPPPWPKIFSISCSFSQNLAKSYVGAPPPWRVGAPSYGESWIRPWLRNLKRIEGFTCSDRTISAK